MAQFPFRAVPTTEPSSIPAARGTQAARPKSLRFLGCSPRRVSDLWLWTVRAARCLQTSLLKTRVFDVWTARVKALAGSPARIPCPTCDPLRRGRELPLSKVGPLYARLDRASVPV